MKKRLRFELVGCSALFVGWMLAFVDATAQDRSDKLDTKNEARIIEIQKLLECPVESTALPEETTLAKLLAALEAHVPEGKKLSFRIDQSAFGEQLSRVMGARVRCPQLRKGTFADLLRRAMAQVSKVEEIDYTIRPEGVVVTRPRLAAHRMVYNIRKIVHQIPFFWPDLMQDSPGFYRALNSSDGAALLIRFLSDRVALRPWENIELLNGTRLAVFASPTRHEAIEGWLVSLDRSLDVAVVMNARLYEVDRAFFVKHIAPLFTRGQDPHSKAVRIDGPLFKRISREKLLLESDDDKLRPRQKALYLSRRNVLRFNAGPHETKAGEELTGIGLTGVSFEVEPVVSPDRRYLRLRISQMAAQLVGIDKVKLLDLASGKEVEFESPHLRKTTQTATVQLPDGAPILMPVTYRPSDKDSADNVCLMVARPFIWIEEEVKELRREGRDTSPRSVWESEVPKDKTPAPAKRLPFNEEVKEILQGIITDLLTNPKLKDTREFYGTAKDGTVTLVDSETLGWPKEFKPTTAGHKLVEVQEDPFANRRRILGICLDKFNLDQAKSGLFEDLVQVRLFNAGGSANGEVTGGCTVYYELKHVGKHWVVKFASLLDP